MTNLQATFIVLNTICFFINIPPLAWHIMCKNIPAVTLLIYLELMMIDGFVGAVVWGGNSYIQSWDGKGWCDIMIRLQLATSIGITSSISCVSFNLLMIFLTNRATTFWFGNKWVKSFVEIFVSIVFPFVISGVAYFAQTSRYAIHQYIGCSVALVNESISVVTFYLWIFFWCFIGTTISIITLFLYFKKRKASKEILLCTNSGLSVKRFIRLLIYCILVICSSIIFSAIIGSELVITPDIFDDEKITHGQFWGMILKYPHSNAVDINQWTLISISFVSFFLFGVGYDAKNMYVSIIEKLPFGGNILEKFGKLKNFIKFIVGDGLLNDKSRYILSFWDSDDDDGDSDDDKDKYNFEEEMSYNDIPMKDFGVQEENGFNIGNSYGCYCSPSDGNFTAYTEEASIKKDRNMLKFMEHDLNSPYTPNTPNTVATIDTGDSISKYYNDANVRYQLQDAEREVNKERESFDEMKYLYY